MQQLSVSSSEGAVCTVDSHASEAGVEMLRQGGNAVDAAIAASAVLTVTSQHMCGMGGDLFALVHLEKGDPFCLNASGWAGSGADPDRLRAEGHKSMPFKGDIRSVPVPGCVDGWVALAERFANLPLATLLAPAIEIAGSGFSVPGHLAASAKRVADVPGADDYQGLAKGDRLVRPGIERSLSAIATGGRDQFYLGEFGDALLEIGDGEYGVNDLQHHHAEWVDPLWLDAWNHRLWTVPPNSQGYLSLLGAGIAEGLDIPKETDDGLWSHLLVEAARHAAFDRIDALFDGADGMALLQQDLITKRRSNIKSDSAASLGDTYAGGGTIYLSTTDKNGGGVSFIQSNASGFGVHLVAPGTGIFLQNRGAGFNLTPGHPAEYQAGKRAPHTLSPAMITTMNGTLRTVLGTMGGDAQPQIVLQMLVRLLVNGQTPAEILSAPRWVLEPPNSNGFDSWVEPDKPHVILEPDCPASWAEGLKSRGHNVEQRRVNVGHAHMIDIVDQKSHGATEPRINTSAALAP